MVPKWSLLGNIGTLGTIRDSQALFTFGLVRRGDITINGGRAGQEEGRKIVDAAVVFPIFFNEIGEW